MDGYAWTGTGTAPRTIGWNAEGEIVSLTRSGATSAYGYDELGRLSYSDEALRVERKAEDQASGWGSREADVGGTKGLVQSRASVRLDYHATSVGLDLGTVEPINRARLLKSDARLSERTVQLYASSDNASWTELTGWTWSPKSGSVELLFAAPFAARYVKLHCAWDERDGNNEPVDLSSVSGRPYEILELWYATDGQETRYSYDANGNRLTQATSSGSAYESRGYTYYESTNRIKYISQGGVIVWAFAYDANGNMITRAKGAKDKGGSPDFASATETWVYEYDLSNRLVRVLKGAAGIASAVEVARYAYDYRNLRVQSVEAGTTTRYEYDQSGDLLYRSDGSEAIDYISALGQLWAEVRTKGQASSVYWHHVDHLGTTEALSDQNGAIVWEAGYSAFGNKLSENGQLAGRKLFTGKEYDEIVGLYYFNARWYDSELGRFISEDPARDQNNWYAYCSNNPLAFTDPTGLETLGAWIGRNWQNVVSVSLSGIEVAAGAALSATGVGSAVGVPMMIHGGANAAAGVAKMAATTIAANTIGSAEADKLNAKLPDSGLGMIAYGLLGGNEKAGAIADLVDAGIGFGLGAGSSKAVDTVIDMASTARKAGIFLTEEQKAVMAMGYKPTASIVVDSLVEVGGNVLSVVGAKDNCAQAAE